MPNLNFIDFKGLKLVLPLILMKYKRQRIFTTKLLKKKYEVGVGYRTNSSMHFLAGFHITNHIRILYNYNKNTKSTLMDTHGIVLNFRLNNGFMSKE